MRYIQVVEQQNSILKNINVDDIAYITNSYIYFLTNRNSRVTNSMSDITARLRAADGRWVGWEETTDNFLHIKTVPIIVIPESIKDIVGSQIRFKNLQTITVDESFLTIISMIPPEAPPQATTGTYVGSQYININSNNVISAITADIDNNLQQGLVLNTDVYTHFQTVTNQINNLGNHANLSNLDYANSGHIGFQKALTSANAGAGISITIGSDNEVIISSTVTPGTSDHAGLSNLDYANSGHIGFQKALTPGTGISITTGPNNEEIISASIEWGQITGTLSQQTDLQTALNTKQGTLTAGTNITIDANNVISATGGGSTYTAGSGIDIDANDEISVIIDNSLSIDQNTNEISTNNIIWRTW